MKNFVMKLILLFAISSMAVGADLRLIEAVKAKADTQTVQLLLQEQLNVNEQQSDGVTAMHWAVHRDDLDLAEQLIQAGADMNISDLSGATPLWVAVYNSSPDMVDKLLQAGANPDMPLHMGETPLMTAADIGNLKIVKALVSAKADVDARETQGGQTALMWAAAGGHTDVANFLIESGADVRSHSKGGFTPLHFATLNGSLESTQLLMSMDAEVNETSNDGGTPLLIAAASGNDKLTQYLLELGADPKARDYRGFTALHYAAMKRNMSGSVTRLLAAGADLNDRVKKAGAEHELHSTPDLSFLKSPTRIIEAGTKSRTIPTGATPYYLASQQRNAAAMRILLENGADPHMGTTETVFALGGSGRRVNFMAKNTPLMAAAGMDLVVSNWNDLTEDVESQALEAVKTALEAGADVNAKNEYGMTALHAATIIGAASIVDFLVKSGANLDAKDQYGQTPLSIANHVITTSLNRGNNFDVRPRRYRPEISTYLMAQGATPLEKSGVDVYEILNH